MENQNEFELDLRELFYYLKKRIWIVALVTALCMVLGLAVSVFLIQPKYTASTRVYVLNRANETSVVYSDIQISTYMLYDYQVLITGQNVTKEVISQLGLNMTPNQLASRINVSSESNTRVLQIDVTDSSPQRAADIVNSVREVAAAQIQEIMDVDAVKLVYEADVPKNPSSPNVMLNTLLAAALGFIAVVGICVVRYVLDDTIRTEEDVERYLGLSTLGIIPISSDMSTLSNAKAVTGKAGAKSAKPAKK